MDSKIWIIGHKNPDTDSICAAIAYAYLKNEISDFKVYEAKRAGELNEETKFVLDKFHVESPGLVEDVGSQIKDIEIRRTAGVSGKISLKRAWEMMKEQNVVTLPITDRDDNLEGLIITADIATSYMDVYDNRILSTAKTPYKNLIETLNGAILCGDETSIFKGGKVIVGSANPEIMEDFLEDNDLVLMGSRYEAQLCALEANASCIIVAGDPKVSKTIIKLAEAKGCVLITTPYDTYTAARLINQSMPIDFFMRKENLITFDTDEYIEEIREIMSKEKHRDFPVLDENSKYVGMMSRRNLLNMKKKQLILVDHNEKSQAVESIESADILEIIDHHRIGSLETMGPVFFRNQPVGSTATIVYQMYQETGAQIPTDIAGLLCSAILSDTLMYRSPTCTAVDRAAAEDLAGIAGINTEEHAKEMFRAGSNFKNKTPEEIFYQDFKAFHISQANFGVAQISAMTQQDLEEVKEELLPYLEYAMNENRIEMVFVMLTNILEETTYLLAAGENANQIAQKAFQTEKQEPYFILKGVVSRKKQLIPAFMAALQEDA